ncbi:hypothetical protein [Neptuniibacter sp. QD37_11]|uniref:hypothetical protein n=1 Tax=Neptuniibacter sp. QD37_11 TaxID=3398209 RepID=UPI0039F4491A
MSALQPNHYGPKDYPRWKQQAFELVKAAWLPLAILGTVSILLLYGAVEILLWLVLEIFADSDGEWLYTAFASPLVLFVAIMFMSLIECRGFVDHIIHLVDNNRSVSPLTLLRHFFVNPAARNNWLWELQITFKNAILMNTIFLAMISVISVLITLILMLPHPDHATLEVDLQKGLWFDPNDSFLITVTAMLCIMYFSLQNPLRSAWLEYSLGNSFNLKFWSSPARNYWDSCPSNLCDWYRRFTGGGQAPNTPNAIYNELVKRSIDVAFISLVMACIMNPFLTLFAIIISTGFKFYTYAVYYVACRDVYMGKRENSVQKSQSTALEGV